LEQKYKHGKWSVCSHVTMLVNEPSENWVHQRHKILVKNNMDGTRWSRISITVKYGTCIM